MRFKNRFMRHAVKGGLRLSFKLPSLLPLPVSALRSGMALGARLLPVRKGVTVVAETLGGVPGERLPPPLQTHRVLLHFHGGAFMTGSPATHRGLASELAVRAAAVVHVPDYRLAPEHPYPAALDDAQAAYESLLKEGVEPAHIVLGGDSAGATLALTLVMRLRTQGRPLPAALLLLSPYVDSSLGLASIKARKFRDPMLTARVLKRGSDGYRADLSATNACISPLFADLQGLPPVLVQAGTEEILHDDACELVKRLEAAGVAVNCHLYAGMWHDFQLFSGLVDEADIALDEAARFIRERVS